MNKAATKTVKSPARHPQYEQLMETINQLPDRGPCKCPACDATHPSKHGLRVHFARKHGGSAWRPFSKKKRPKNKAKAATSKKPGDKKPGSVFREPVHQMNYCPNCAFNLSILRVATELGGGRQ